MQNQVKEIKDLVANNKLELALAKMEELPLDETGKNTVLQLSSRLVDTKNQNRLGSISSEAHNIELNKIRAALLDLATDIELEADKENYTLSAAQPLNEDQIQVLIQSQKKSIRFYVILVAMMLLFGGVIVFFGMSMQNDASKTVSNLGGVFVASLSGLSVRQIIKKNETLGVLAMALASIRDISANSRMNEIIWRKIEKILLA